MKNFPLIILAAGKSSRMKTPKGLLDFNGKTLLEFQIDRFLSSGGKKVFVVLGNYIGRYKTDFPWDKYSGEELEIINNESPERGQFSSVQLACERLEGEKAAWIIPVDCPAPDKQTWEQIENMFMSGILVVVPQFERRGGHPLLVSAEFMQSLISLDLKDVDSRLDHQIKKLDSELVAKVDVTDSNIQLNLNKPEDFKKFLDNLVE